MRQIAVETGEKTGSVEVIYTSCIHFYNVATRPPSSPTLHLTTTLLPHLLLLLLLLLLGSAPPHRHTKEQSLSTPAPWLRFCRHATAALCKWKTGHNFPKMLFFITYFPFISLPRTIDGWWHLWQLNVFMDRFIGYLLLAFYSSNSVKMLISQIRRGRVRVYVFGTVSHPAKCMHEGATFTWLHCSA